MNGEKGYQTTEGSAASVCERTETSIKKTEAVTHPVCSYAICVRNPFANDVPQPTGSRHARVQNWAGETAELK